jgi:hypothetical protein
MRVLKIEDPTHIAFPEDVGERLGLKEDDVMVITLEEHRVILEKRPGSPVDASFSLWAHLPPGPAYVDALRDEWDTQLTEHLCNG